jgi:hypothetical protein
MLGDMKFLEHLKTFDKVCIIITDKSRWL